MYTLGYEFKPWADAKAIADGSTIRRYIVETAAERGIDRQVRFGHRVVSADWSSADARWTVEVEHDGRRERQQLRLPAVLQRLLPLRRGATGRASPAKRGFRGRIVHPQFWPDDLDHAGRRVVVIGSGATAVTLVPEMAKTAAHVTMLQRSPSYIVALPSQDPIAEWLQAAPAGARSPTGWCDSRTCCSRCCSSTSRARWPDRIKARLIGEVARRLGPGHDVATALHAALQPVGPAPLRRARRRPVPRDQARPRVGRHRLDRPLHRARHPARVGARARGRHHRHRDRAEAERARRRRAHASTASRATPRRR